ncbi:16S rRNA (cytosine967-C5)-methyltransferase [Caloramator fervidus]|uniref:16S rRNA (cytosine(967)-C(5))-methyltransferase n=1 Tax=Caloramator fervidus TaxID=29344 RepID=A0A1H5U0Q0_9CLOT|nr:16S rRNA (cytosine(967)-C(5))-methyltransferase RsmB [Caloramator fervidus]SEF67847.1 16S rRNA (cytosine967-C5)-methyltransferase [Caloramator fervidus]
MKDKARFIVVKVLTEIEENKAFSNIKLNQYFKKYDLTSLDRAFATEVLYGTVRWKLRIDYFIQSFLNRNIDTVNLWALNCIRIAVYQIFFMDKIPDFAAVNQSVDICKAKFPKLSGFVNGVLRNILRNKESFNVINESDPIKFMSIKYSHPEWLVRYFTKLFNQEFLEELMMANNQPPKLTIRVNTLKISKDNLREKLLNRGIKVYDGILEECLILEDIGHLEKVPEFIEGLFFIQDQGSMLTSKVLNPLPGQKILDMCAAPGGKTTHLAQLMKNKGEIVAFDIYKHKINLILDNAKRLGINIIKPVLKDATVYMEELNDSFDKILLDAPCSGLGLLRKKPEIRWNIKEEDIFELTKIQKVLLNNASKYVKIGGEIVYSTCTITKEENEDIIEDFLDENKNFELVDISNFVCDKLFIKNDYYLRLYPNLHDTDGFFICKLKRLW